MLRESEARYRGVFKDSTAVIILFDPENFAIVDANTSAASYYGLPCEEQGIAEFYFYQFCSIL